MSELEQAIEEITYCNGGKFPKEAFRAISANREDALPLLRKAVENAIKGRKKIGEDYQLHLYAIYFLGQFHDQEFFPKLVEFFCLPEKKLDDLIGDAITDGVANILYNTYNGDLELLKQAIRNDSVYEFVRSAMLDVMAQLYMDGDLSGKEFRDFLSRLVYDSREKNYIYNEIGYIICKCHLAEMLPELHLLLDENLMDPINLGEFDSCVDELFYYDSSEEVFCEKNLDAADHLRYWEMFEDDPSEDDDWDDEDRDEDDLDRMFGEREKSVSQPITSEKVGRNSLCPCGSGKKYKFCCMNKPKGELDMIESLEGRQSCLETYPYMGPDRIEGRVYLDDYFDETSIEIDKILYLGLINRSGLLWEKHTKAEERRTVKYLYLAFQKMSARMEQEHITEIEEYDARYSIHYYLREWMYELIRLSMKYNDDSMVTELEEWVDRYEE